ncbi:MAG TPA: hypothetical protein PK077_11000 [Akkermansia muciniphila]|jgi:hypothetical protein|uniref:hypothetical protein n=1 Tax=Akkermansia sp. TaxID=1872421 RepID=UPI00257F823C|nr:hypothetical protein [Akkermansia sp.]HRN24864.1 hypothetical protein [Akkermansia muciniphila]
MMTAVSASQPGWLKGQRILRIGSGIHSVRLKKEYAVHGGIILLDTGIRNVNGLPFVYFGNVNTTF